MAECLVGFSVVANGSLQLSHEEPFACLLFAAHLVTDDFPQVGDGLGVVASVDVVVGQRVVPFLLGTPMDGVALHVADDVFGIVEPLLLHIAFSQPGTGTAVDGWLSLVETSHVGKGGGSLVEGTLVEL